MLCFTLGIFLTFYIIYSVSYNIYVSNIHTFNYIVEDMNIMIKRLIKAHNNIEGIHNKKSLWFICKQEFDIKKLLK